MSQSSQDEPGGAKAAAGSTAGSAPKNTWKIDRYEVIEQIGTGAMGIVYRVHDPRFSCDRAIKLLRKELIDDKDIVARFSEEGRAAVRASGEISHPNIVTVYDAGFFETRPYIVMELFKGIPLDAMIESGKKFTIEHILSIGAQLSSALVSAHHHGVVHRDIKPANVLMSENGNVAKLTDFSVARVNSEADNNLTRTGVVIGAPRYMPPEQALGLEVDGRSDLYGLGVVLYEMLTGEKAYKSDTFTALLIEIAQTEPKPVRAINKEIPPGVERIISKLLEKKQERRFQDGIELEAALRREIRNLNATELRAQRGVPAELLGAGLLGLLVMVLMGITGYLLRNQQVDAFQKQTAAVGTSYASALSRQFSLDYARSGDDAGLLYQAQFSESIEGSNFEYQHIVLNNSRILASTSEEMVRQRYEEPAELRQISDPKDKTQIALVSLPNKKKALQIAKPIEIGPVNRRKKVGTLYVGLSTDRIDSIGRLTASLMALMTFLVSALIALVSYFIVRRFAVPLERLRDSLNELATGDHDIRMTAVHKGLIGQTFAAFNKAAGSLTMPPEPEPVPTPSADMPAPEFSRKPVKPKIKTKTAVDKKSGSKPKKEGASLDDKTTSNSTGAAKKKQPLAKGSLQKEPLKAVTVKAKPASAQTLKAAKKITKDAPGASKNTPAVKKVTKTAPPKTATTNKSAAAKNTTTSKAKPTKKSAPAKTSTKTPRNSAPEPKPKVDTQTPPKNVKAPVDDIPVLDPKTVPVDAKTRIFRPEE